MDSQGICVFFLVIKIPYHDGWSAQADLTKLAIWNRFVCSHSTDSVIGVRIWESDASFTLLIVRGQTACGNAFGCSIALTDMDRCTVSFKESVKAFLKFDRQRIAPGEYSAKEVKVFSVQVLISGDRLEQRRHARYVVWLFGLY